MYYMRLGTMTWGGNHRELSPHFAQDPRSRRPRQPAAGEGFSVDVG